MSKWIAHKRDDGKEQTIREHLRGTAELAGNFAASFEASEQGELVGWAHDIGKYSTEFQRRILEGGPKTDHSTAGAYECAKRNQVSAAFCVAGHHSGLLNLGSKDDYNEGTLLARINHASRKRIPESSAW